VNVIAKTFQDGGEGLQRRWPITTMKKATSTMKQTKSGSKKEKAEPLLSANRCADQGTERLRGETLAQDRSLIKQADSKWSRRGSGEGFRYRPTARGTVVKAAAP
jgi:hypothetical protein